MNISKISIRDFKALGNVVFSPGKVNVFIGPNGAGKSTILEAVGLLSSAMTDRVDNDSLLRKGIRLSAPSLYKSNFRNAGRRNPTIELGMDWICPERQSQYRYNVNLNPPSEVAPWRYHSEKLYGIEGDSEKNIWGRSGRSQEMFDSYVGGFMMESVPELQQVRPSIEAFKNYAIYQPVTPILRGNADNSQRDPIGLNGGRLAEALEDIIQTDHDGNTLFGSIPYDDVLELLDWAEDFTVASPTKARVNAAVSTSRRIIEFQDRFMKSGERFTAYDASEGSLYVLFLLCLAVHPKAPGVFSVDSFDHAMHPRLARATTRLFCDTIIREDKTAFITTHNPLVLDGLDLADQNIKLFTVERSQRTGFSQVQQIEISDKILNEGHSLSRLWVDGRLGGVPNLL